MLLLTRSISSSSVVRLSDLVSGFHYSTSRFAVKSATTPSPLDHKQEMNEIDVGFFNALSHKKRTRDVLIDPLMYHGDGLSID